MSRDIRSFFTVISKKSGTDSKPKPAPAPPAKRRNKRVIDDSDDEDVIAATPEPAKKAPKRKPAVVLSSDSEDDRPPKPKVAEPKAAKASKLAKTEPPKLKPVNVTEVFGNTPVKQTKVEAPPKPKAEAEKTKVAEGKAPKKSRGKKGKKGAAAEAAVHQDEAFEKTLFQLDDEDDDLLASNFDFLDKTVDDAMNAGAKSEGAPGGLEDVTGAISGGKKQMEAKSEGAALNDEDTPGDKKRARRDSSSESKSTPKKKPKMEHSDSGIDPGQEAHEKRRYSAMLYQKFLHRGGPKNHGAKELPQGKPDCLKNLCFLKTGVLDSLESEEFGDLVKRHGGRVVHSVSKKVNYVVVGDDPGPSKLEKARTYNIPAISEDALLDLILEKSGMPAKYCKKEESCLSEDLGLGGSEEGGSSPKSPCQEEEPRTADGGKETDSGVFVQDKERRDSKKRAREEKGREKSAKTAREEGSSSGKDEEKNGERTKMASEAKTAGGEEESTYETEKAAERPKVASEYLSLTEKYKPADLKAIIGQQGDGSNMNKLRRWLLNWRKNQRPEVRKKLPRPSPWAKSDDGAYFKCALLSGPPGVGKTTTATLVAQDLGLDVVEFNASDTRSKRLLHEEVSQLLSTNTIAGFAYGKSKTSKDRVLLMDEVDGMAGNEDRGGMQELIQLIRNSSIPIVCMCNDRMHPKIRSLVNYCFDLKFAKPKLEQIRGAMMSICFKEGLKLAPNALSEIISGTGCDVRQTLNNLQMWATPGKTVTMEEAEKEAKGAKKDTVMGPWEVCRAVFTNSEHKDMSLAEKSKLFFYDYSLGPLFVQENYLKVQPAKAANPKEALRRAAAAADCISMGDVIDSQIRRSNNWSLLESQAMYSSVFPGYFMSGHFKEQINFPSWLGKNSKKNKFNRLLCEIQAHTRITTSASKQAIQLDYLRHLRDAILLPMQKEGMGGVQKSVDVMKGYNLLREDLDGLIELCQWPTDHKNPMDGIPSTVKSAFTRAYNKQVPLLPFATVSATAKKRAAVLESSDLLGEEEETIESGGEEESMDVGKDAAIKVKAKKPSAKRKDKDFEGPSTSKMTESKKGKGKKK